MPSGGDAPPAGPVPRVVLDTNVALDFLDSARAAHQAAMDLVTALIRAGAWVGLAATSLKDVYYLITRAAGEPAARRAVTAFTQTLDILPVDAHVCAQALDSGEPDFEDGLIRACAEAANADWIVTRDAAAFANSAVPKTDAATLLRALGPGPGGEAQSR